jgi:hypothetical protein
MFIYIVINDTNYPIGSFIEIQDARDFRDKNTNCKIIKSTLVGNLPNKSLGSKLTDKMGLNHNDIKKAKTELPDEFKHLFGMPK